ncbi:MAG: amidohydrolase family protein [Candidatus Puniceispirillaceae bacterium]
MSSPDYCAPANKTITTPRMALPEGACDCHFHIFDAPSIQVPMRGYSAPPATVSDYRILQKTLGFQRSVIVQPSVYGSDNETSLSVCQSDPNMKAVIVVDDDVTDAQLRTFHDRGAVGCRVNLLFASGIDYSGIDYSDRQSDKLTALAKRIADYGWHLQLLADISQCEDWLPALADLPVPVMFDHMGHMPAHLGTSHPAFQRFLSYLADGKIWAKLSAAYRITNPESEGYDDVAAFVSSLVDANPEQLVWGTDWPHPKIPGAMPDDGDLVNWLFDWIPNGAHQKAIFTDNPEKFYGF